MFYGQDIIIIYYAYNHVGRHLLGLIAYRYLLVKGKLTVILEKKPSGGYLTKGIESDGVMTRVVPGGNARRPSAVTHRILFCLECGVSSFLCASALFKIKRLISRRVDILAHQ